MASESYNGRIVRDGHITVLSAQPYQAARDSLSKNLFESSPDSPWPTAIIEGKAARGHIQLRPAALDDAQMMSSSDLHAMSEEMRRQQEELSDLDADVLDALAAYWLNRAPLVNYSVQISVNEILRMRGLKPKMGGNSRRGGYEPKQRRAVIAALGHIDNLWLDLAEVAVVEGFKGRLPIKRSFQSRAFVITDRTLITRSDGSQEVESIGYRPGELLGRYLEGPGYQVALLSAKALHYDPSRQRWEKRLARYLSWQWPTKARSGEYLWPYRVATLLDAAGDEPNPASHRAPWTGSSRRWTRSKPTR